MRVFITGTAGFIGFHTARRFLDDGHDVIGFDGFTKYYDPKLKRNRDGMLRRYQNYISIEGMLEDQDLLKATVERYQPEVVIHLAAQAGVRYSIEEPSQYISSNVQGTFNLLEVLRYNTPKHFLFASTSSVYGGNEAFPFQEEARTAFPLSLYAATKAACESLTHSYASLFNIPTTCIRFFTVYGPWGRPDMALYKFVEKIQRGEQIEVYGNGEMSRDFTYVDDLVESIVRLTEVVPTVAAEGEHGSPVAPWRVVNIAGGRSTTLSHFIDAIEEALGVKANKCMLPLQAGDVIDTLASPELLIKLTGFRPSTPVKTGVKAFVDWYKSYQLNTAGFDSKG